MNRSLAGVLAFSLLLPGCSHGGGQSLDSTTLPGYPIISYPATQDRTMTTTFLSNPNAQVSGIAGQALTITLWHGPAPTDLLALDADGNLGLRSSLSIHGDVTTVSTRTAKKDIEPYHGDPLALLRNVRIVTYRYKNEVNSSQPHIGFIAEDTPSQLSGARHNEFVLNNSVAVSMAAEQQLDARTRALEAEIQELKKEIRALRNQAHH